MGKKILALLLAASVGFAAGAPAFAAEKPVPRNESMNSGIHILWVNTDTVRTDLTFSGNRADCSCIIHAKAGTSKIAATAYLKRVESNGTTTLKTWTGLGASGDSFYFDKAYYVASGKNYEFEIVAKVTRNGKVETIRQSSMNYCDGR